MRRVVLALTFAFVLLAVPALAQNDEGTYGTQETESTTQSQPAASELQDTRTSPDTGVSSPGGGLTITGTVESWNDREIAIRTTTGVEHLVIQPTTRRPSTFTPGQRVTIDYNRSTQNGVMIAEEIRVGGLTTGESSVDVESQLEQDVEEAAADLGEAADEVGAELSELDEAAEEEIEEALDTNIDNDDTLGETTVADADDDMTALPATAGEAPLVALLGLAALGAAAGLRRLS